MYRKAWVCCGIGLALASITLACGRPAGLGQPGEQALRNPNANEIVITVTCPPPQSNAAVRVAVHPRYKEVDAGVDVVWTREGRGIGTHSATFSIDPADRANWPWEDGAFPWTDATSITGTAKEEQDTDEKKYNITVGCNDDEMTFDPRMKVR